MEIICEEQSTGAYPSNGSAPRSMAAPPARRFLGMRTRSFNKTGFDLIDCQISSFQVIDGLGVSYKITLR